MFLGDGLERFRPCTDRIPCLDCQRRVSSEFVPRVGDDDPTVYTKWWLGSLGILLTIQKVKLLVTV
jgi:hypothetical protein